MSGWKMAVTSLAFSAIGLAIVDFAGGDVCDAFRSLNAGLGTFRLFSRGYAYVVGQAIALSRP